MVFAGGMCGSVEEKVFNANMELMGVIESERNAIRKRHVWKLLEEQDRVSRSYYAKREGFERGGQGTQGQTGLGREHVGHGYICKRQKKQNGLAMQEPRQEDGSQTLKRSRGGGATVE